MRDTALLSIVVPAALMTLMLGLGLTLDVGDFARVFRTPRFIAVGLGAQLLLLPILGVGIALVSGLEAPLALGLVVLALCPGGALSNAICNFVRADLALSVSLTALASLVTPFSIPLLYAGAAGFWVGPERAFELPLAPTMTRLVAVSIVPIAVGMVVRRGLGSRAERVETPVRFVSIALFLVVVAAIVVQNLDSLGTGLQSLGATALALNLSAMAMGAGLARLARSSGRVAVTIGIEVGMQNVATATFVTVTLLGDSTMALVPAVYALVMLPSAVVFGLVARSRIDSDAAEP